MKTILVLTAMVVSMGWACRGAVVEFNNLGQWAAAVNQQYDLEDFEDETLVAQLTLASGMMGFIGNGIYFDAVSRGEGMTRWDLGRPTYGFGGQFSLTPGGIGQNLRFRITPVEGEQVVLYPAGEWGLENPFYGFVTDFAFQQVMVDAGDGQANESPGGAQETYSMEFLVYNGKKGPGGAGEVPEPATLALAGAGLTALALWKRR